MKSLFNITAEARELASALIEGDLSVENNEYWKDIHGYEGYYQISNLGNVKSLKRMVNHVFGQRTVNEKILKTPNDFYGYLIVSLRKNNFRQTFTVHRLVASHFLDNGDKKVEVNHKNGIKTDNRVENLEWVTCQENMAHAVLTGLKISSKGENHGRSKITKLQALEIRNESDSLSLKEISKKYNISLSTASQIRTGKTWKHL